jgi:predicted thioesterase
MSMKIIATAELIEVREETLRFRVDCYDECGLIGSGFHERRAVNPGRFMAKVRRKAGQAALLAA